MLWSENETFDFLVLSCVLWANVVEGWFRNSVKSTLLTKNEEGSFYNV